MSCRIHAFIPRFLALLLAAFSLVGALYAQRDYSTPYTFTTIAGVAGSIGSTDGIGIGARFDFPSGIAADGFGNLYVVEHFIGSIRKITAAGVVTVFASGFNLFSVPYGVATDDLGNLYVADYGNRTIRKITSTGTVSTLAGLPGSRGSTDGIGSAARFASPFAVAADGSGNIYVADYGNHTIRKITSAGTVTTLAGLADSPGSADGAGSAARFNQPVGIAVDLAGNVYVADYQNKIVRKITPAGVVTTLAGLANSTGSIDGPGSVARFQGPIGIAVDSSGAVYVTDNYTIRKISPAGTVTTLAGIAGTYGTTDGVGNAALFSLASYGIAVDAAGKVYVADTANRTIRSGYLWGSAPSDAVVTITVE